MPPTNTGQSSGRAPEAGSVHRRGVAAVLACYGLAGRGIEAVGYPTTGPSPEALAFETDDHVDDIRCELTNGDVLYIQAKRTCGNDRHFKATVEQWAAQAPLLRDGDRLVLAVAEPAGPVKYLDDALARVRAGLPGGSVGENKAIRALADAFPPGTTEEVRTKIQRHARVLVVKAERAGQDGFDKVAMMLENVVVPAHDGPEAVRALCESVHTQAGKALGSRLPDWLDALAAARITVFADGAGPSGPRLQAERVAVATYRETLAGRRGLLHFSLLADDIEPMHYENLAESIQVTLPRAERSRRDSRGLLDVARRWRRMLLIGLPGAGKSTAIAQLAAAWAGDPDAPLPIVVSLRTLAARVTAPEQCTLVLLLELATEGTASVQRVPLIRAMEAAVHDGHAVMLLDGLDECRARAALVAEGLRATIDTLPDGTGVVLASRPSAATPAARFNLPVAELAEPIWFPQLLRHLLEHVAQQRRVSEDAAAWVAARDQWLDGTRQRHPDLCKVPLLATLLALLAAEVSVGELPANRAELLLKAVRQSVARWERSRPAPDGEWLRDLRPDLLLAGFAEIGHLIASADDCDVATARHAVTARMRSDWARAPGEALPLANDVLRFWDQHIGVFVHGPDGSLVARSRVFAEIADAMWAQAQPAGERAAWLRSLLVDETRRETFLLAAGLDSDLVRLLLDAAESDSASTAAQWAKDAIDNGVPSTTYVLSSLIEQLGRAAGAHLADEGPRVTERDPTSEVSDLARREVTPLDQLRSALRAGREQRGGAHWVYVRHLATLSLPADLRAARSRWLASFALDDEQRTIAAVLTGLTDAAHDRRDLDADEVTAVNAMLALPLPEDTAPVQTSRRLRDLGTSAPLLSGHARAAELALEHLSQLRTDAPEIVARIAEKGSVRQYDRIKSRLSELDHADKLKKRSLPGFAEMLSSIAAFDLGWDVLLRAAAIMANPIDPSPSDQWRAPELVALFDALQAAHTSFPSYRAAVESDPPSLVEGWVRATAHAAELDLGRLAGQAKRLLQQPAPARTAFFGAALTPPPYATRINPEWLTRDDHEALVAGLAAVSDWIMRVSSSLLVGIRSDALADMLAEATPSLRPRARFVASTLRCIACTDTEGVSAALLTCNDAPSRAGAARALNMLATHRQLGDPSHRLLTAAREDRDMTVRMAAGASDDQSIQAECWSCIECGAVNSMPTLDCHNCTRGTRPGPHP